MPQHIAPPRFNLVFRGQEFVPQNLCARYFWFAVIILELKINRSQSVSMVRSEFVILGKLRARSIIANVFYEDEENWRFSMSS